MWREPWLPHQIQSRNKPLGLTYPLVHPLLSALDGRASSFHPDGAGAPLVDRVAELEEKLVNCSMENATAKQVS